MKNLMSNVLIFYLSLSMGTNIMASNSDKNKDQNVDKGFNSVDMIMHHIAA